MNILRDIERKIVRLKSETAEARADLKLRKLMYVVKSGFDPSQPRDEQGRWTDTGAASQEGYLSSGISQLASYSNSAICNLQYKSDLFHCKIVGLSTCYAQAMVRLIACERGHPIPPLNY